MPATFVALRVGTSAALRTIKTFAPERGARMRVARAADGVGDPIIPTDRRSASGAGGFSGVLSRTPPSPYQRSPTSTAGNSDWIALEAWTCSTASAVAR